MFRFLINLFSKNIIVRHDISRYFIYKYPVKGRRVKVNSKLEVPPGFTVVVVVRGRVADVVASGKHRINASLLPETFRKLHLGVASKKGNYKKRFKAQVYFVNLKTFAGVSYYSNDPFVVRSDKFGRIKGYCEGVANINIDNADQLLTRLFRFRNKISNRQVTKIIKYWVGNSVNKMLEKSKMKFSDILLKPQNLSPFLNPSINDLLTIYGIQVDNVKLISLRLSNKMQKKVNEFLSNRASFGDVLDQEWSVEVFNEESQFEQPQVVSNLEPMQPQQAEVVQPTPAPQVALQNTMEAQPVNNNPLLKRRLSSAAILDDVKSNSNSSVSANINATSLLESENNLKQCKYCGQTIEMHFKYCPKCGFKQG